MKNALAYAYGVFIFLLTLPSLIIGYLYGTFKFAFLMGYKASISGQKEEERMAEVLTAIRAMGENKGTIQ